LKKKKNRRGWGKTRCIQKGFGGSPWRDMKVLKRAMTRFKKKEKKKKAQIEKGKGNRPTSGSRGDKGVRGGKKGEKKRSRRRLIYQLKGKATASKRSRKKGKSDRKGKDYNRGGLGGGETLDAQFL